MKILFPAHPLKPKNVDISFEDEYQAALKASFDVEVVLIDESGKIDRDLPDETYLYRGWMLSPDAYKKLAQKINLFTGYKSYKACHWLPHWYPKINGHTPSSIHAVKEKVEDALKQAVNEYGDHGFIIKGYVKSLKHRWDEAMFVPPQAGLDHAKKVLKEYLSDPDDSPGVVFRKYMPIKVHENGVKREFRVFFWGPSPNNARWLISGPYYGERGRELGLGAAGIGLPEEVKIAIESLAFKIPSPFFTMDVAELTDGGWTIIEVGDGGVSGLQGIGSHIFYPVLKDSISWT